MLNSLSKESCSLPKLALDSPPELRSAARELLLEYGQFVAAQPGVAGFCLGALEQEAANLPQSYLDQGGGAIVAVLGDLPVGFVAWRSLPALQLASAWELKRLWIRPQARGVGIGRALVQAVVDLALVQGKTDLYLDTAPDAMAAAHRLYFQMGFVECPPYNGRAATGIVYMTKRL
jgi:GNAT superfamily N-acetyltransferase